jgi:hypothetical protein
VWQAGSRSQIATMSARADWAISGSSASAWSTISRRIWPDISGEVSFIAMR